MLLLITQTMCVLMLFTVTCAVLGRGFFVEEPITENILTMLGMAFCTAVSIVGWTVVVFYAVGFNPFAHI